LYQNTILIGEVKYFVIADCRYNVGMSFRVRVAAKKAFKSNDLKALMEIWLQQ
jgi:hypothetical protein